MADTKLSALTELAAAPASDDEIYIRDVSEAASAESKRITIANAVSGVAIAIATLTTRGDILFRNATVPARLAKGAANTVLVMGANDPAWSATLAGLTLTAPILNGTVTLGSTPIFDAGSGKVQIDTTGATTGLLIRSSQDGNRGVQIQGETLSASPLADDVLLELFAKGKDDVPTTQEYGFMRFLIENPATANPSGKMAWWNMNLGSWNIAMTLSAAGVVAGDLAYAEFDDYDDTELMVLNALPTLEKIGVVSRKDTGSGYMLNFQKAHYLSWGGIRQNRAKIDDMEERLVKAGI